MLKRFLLRERGEFFEQREVVDSPVMHTQRSLSGGTLQLRILACPMYVPESGAAQMLFPFRRQPGANWNAVKVRFEIDTLVLSNAGCSLTANRSFAVLLGREIEIVNRQQGLCDENVCTQQIKIGNQRHLQGSAARHVIEIRAVRCDEQLSTEKSCRIAAEPPRHIRTLGFNPLQK